MAALHPQIVHFTIVFILVGMASRRPVEHPGIGDLELAERQLIDVAGALICGGKRGRQPMQPAPDECSGHGEQ